MLPVSAQAADLMAGSTSAQVLASLKAVHHHGHRSRMHHHPHIEAPPAPSATNARTACPRALPLAAALDDGGASWAAIAASQRAPRPCQGASCASAKAQPRRSPGRAKARRVTSRLGVALIAQARVAARWVRSRRTGVHEGSGAPLHAHDRPGAFLREPFMPDARRARSRPTRATS